MRCPHCGTDFHETWYGGAVLRGEVGFKSMRNGVEVLWHYRATKCSKCKELIIGIAPFRGRDAMSDWRMVYPISATRGPVPPDVPERIATDYVEACNVLAVSAKASATLSRRCLQNILHDCGYKGRDLNAEIDLLLHEVEPQKAIPRRLRETIDAIRNFGNFSAHPVDDITGLQIIEVEPCEAEWCLDILEECFEHFYVGPAVVKAKRAALDQKLATAGKPASKG